MGEGNSSSSSTAVAASNSNSKTETPTTVTNTAATALSSITTKKRARSETGVVAASAPAGNNNHSAAAAAAAAETPAATTTAITTTTTTTASSSGSLGDEPHQVNKNSNNSNKKKKTGGNGNGTNITTTTTAAATTTTDPAVLSYRDEIANASSPATVELLSSSLYRLTDGIPMRELKLVVSEARACEKALEAELDLLKRGLELEREQQQQKKKKNRNKNTTTEATNDTAAETTRKTTDASSLSPPSSSPLSPKETATLQAMFESEFTPPDKHWTLSALLGRLRHELTTPLPPSSQLPAHRDKQGLTQLAHNVGIASQSAAAAASSNTSTNNKKTGKTTANPNNNGTGATSANENTSAGATNQTGPVAAAAAAPGRGTDGGSAPGNHDLETASSGATASVPWNNNESSLSLLSQFRKLGALPGYPEYTREHATGTEKLLAVWKKLYLHRSSLVFRRPVNPREAPGYTDRIRFPMDLSLIRKLIGSGHVRSYEGILKKIHLIGHNCVKYNGRESDYALVTREFESVATEYVWTAVHKEARGGGGGRGSRTASPMPVAAAASTATATATANRSVAPINVTGSNAGTNVAARTGNASENTTPNATPKGAGSGNAGIAPEKSGAIQT